MEYAITPKNIYCTRPLKQLPLSPWFWVCLLGTFHELASPRPLRLRGQMLSATRRTQGAALLRKNDMYPGTVVGAPIVVGNFMLHHVSKVKHQPGCQQPADCPCSG
jgi:hypothetical protein